ncbi:MAG TPA: N-formylglutamate amidohydrolase [Aeromicrobium sp.]|nr:N-formylglutamate amidohydrolase [Aeromicrobium sp.]
MTTTNFEVRGASRIPLIAHVPHGGTKIPEEARSSFVLDDAEVDAELLRVTDHHTAELFTGLVEAGGTMFVNHLSRLVFDPERFRSDDDEVMAAQGVGAVYRRTTDGRELRRPDWSEVDRERVLTTFYDPYAAAFAALVRDVVDRFGRCLIVDCHSYPLVPMGWELDTDPDHRPPISFGTDSYHRPGLLVDELEKVCQAAGVRTARDQPFKGTYVPSSVWRKDYMVASIMIEVRRDTYIDECTGALSDGFDGVRQLLDEMVGVMAAWAAPPPTRGSRVARRRDHLVFRPPCTECGAVASSIELVPVGELPVDWDDLDRDTKHMTWQFYRVDSWQLVFVGIMSGNGVGDGISTEEAARIAEAFREPFEFDRIRTADFYDDAGFCGDCRAFYCYVHWNVSSTGGGTCPRGHFKSLDPHWSPDWDDD